MVSYLGSHYILGWWLSWPTPLKNDGDISQLGGWNSQYDGKVIKVMFKTTNQYPHLNSHCILLQIPLYFHLNSCLIWLVVSTLWKIWKSVGMMTFPIYGKSYVWDYYSQYMFDGFFNPNSSPFPREKRPPPTWSSFRPGVGSRDHGNPASSANLGLTTLNLAAYPAWLTYRSVAL